MTCKGCASRRERLKAWFRDLIGYTALANKQGMVYTKYVDTRVGLLQRDIKAITEAGGFLEQTIGKFDEANAVLVSVQKDKNAEINDRLDVLRDLIRQDRLNTRKLDDTIRELNVEIGGLATSVRKLEFPGFESVDYKIADPDDDPDG